jgi:hypothetical protein
MKEKTMNAITTAIANATSMIELQSALENAVEITIGTETTTEDSVNASERLSPNTLRIQREELKVSRATLQRATGLSSSVIWRAEYDGAKPITDEEYLKIYDVLIADWSVNGVPAEYAKTAKVHATQVNTGEATTAALQLVDRHRQFLEDLRQSISDKIVIAKQAKARTKELTQLQTELEDFIKTL